MPVLNNRPNPQSANNAAPKRSIMGNINFFTTMAVVMSALAVKERWNANKDQREEREHSRTSHQIPADAAGGLSNPPPYRDDPNAEDIGLNANAQIRLLGEEDPTFRPTRSKRRSCCVCCGIRCDIFFKALGIVLGLYLCYGVFKIVRWAVTPSPTGLENMPKYGTVFGCSAAPFTYPNNHFSSGHLSADTKFVLEIVGGAGGTVLLTQSDTENVVIKMDLRTDEEPLLQKFSASLSEKSPEKSSTFQLTTPLSGSIPDACMRFDLIVQIPSNLRMLSLTSQSLVHVKYDEQASLALADLTIDLLSPLPGNLLLPHDQLTAERTTLEVRSGYLVGSLAFSESADVSTRRGSAITNIKVAPLAAPASSPDSAAQLSTSSGSGRTDVIYSNPDRRAIASEHTSTGGDMYLTYKAAGYNGRVDVQARSRTSTGLQGTMSGNRGQDGSQELPWAGEKEGKDIMKVRTSGWVGLYF